MTQKYPIVVSVGNVYSSLKTEDTEIKGLLYKSLRFRKQGYIFSPAYQKFRRSNGKRGWDGYTNFFTLAGGRFGTGLLPEVLAGLNNLHLQYTVEDVRPRLKYEPLSEETFPPPKELRDYQIQLGNQALGEMRGIIKAATGAGKTITFSGIVKSLSGTVPTLILFRNRTLVNQTYKGFLELGVPNVGRVHMDYFEPNIITCSTIQSLHHLVPLIPGIRAVIIDECHEFTSNESVRTIRAFKNTPMVLGFSATPFDRKDKVQRYTLKSLIGPILGEISTKELQDRNILSESRIHIIPAREPAIPYALYEEAYWKGIVENKWRNEQVKRIVETYDKGKILILIEKIEHGTLLQQLIPGAPFVYGETKEDERDEAAALLKNKRRKKVVVIASRVWAQGVDIPEIDVLINASAGKSERAAIQKLGRGLRRAEGKDYLDFYDFYDESNHYLEDHSKERLKTYKREGHSINVRGPL